MLRIFNRATSKTIKDKKVPNVLGKVNIKMRLALQILLLVTLFGLLLYSLDSYGHYQIRKKYEQKVSHSGTKSASKQTKITNQLGYSSGLLQSKDELISSLKLDQTTLHSITSGSLFHINVSNEAWRHPFSYLENNGLQVPSKLQRVKVSTYFDEKYMEESGFLKETSIEIEKRKLDIWKRALWAFGFEPVVLDRSHAEKHRLYSDFKDDLKSSSKYKRTYEPFFAWTENNAGLFIDYHVLPVQREVNDQSTLEKGVETEKKEDPNINYEPLDDGDDIKVIPSLLEGNFEFLTLYTSFDYSIFHANKREANKLITQIIARDSDNVVRNTFEALPADTAFAIYTKDSVKKIMGGTEVDESEIADLMDIHMQQSFLRRYARGGLVIIHPMEDDSEIVTYPIKSLATRLAACPDSPYGFSCPPTPRNTNAAKIFNRLGASVLDKGYELCGNPCGQDSPFRYIAEEATQDRNATYYGIGISYSDRLPSDSSNAFGLVGVPHPVTALTLLEKRGDVTVADARQYLQRDTFIRQLTSAFIRGNTVGTRFRLLLCKDSAYQTILRSNTFWAVWERLTVTTLHQLEKMISYEFGFKVPGDEGGVIRLEVAKDVDDASDTTMLATARSRALAVHGEDSAKVDVKDVKAIEAWNLADTELWVFMDAWIQKKKQIVDETF